MTTDYTVHRTDIDAPSIIVPKRGINDTSTDVTLAGRIRLEYGAALDEGLLNILENFSCPPLETDDNIPDLSQTSYTQLHNPTIGQFWFNPKLSQIFFWSGTEWLSTPNRETYAANWGMISHGEQLPKPVSQATGRVFDYSECIWSISPSVFLGKIGYVACATDADARVTMRYRYAASNQIIEGQANYLIIGVPGLTNTGPFPTPPEPSATPTVTPTMTVTPTATVSATVTPTASVTPTVTSSITPTPTPSPTSTPPLSPTPQPSTTATPVVSPTPQPSVTPTSTPGLYSWNKTSTWSGSESAPCRPGEPTSSETDDAARAYMEANPCNASIVGYSISYSWCVPGGPNSIGSDEWTCQLNA